MAIRGTRRSGGKFGDRRPSRAILRGDVPGIGYEAPLAAERRGEPRVRCSPPAHRRRRTAHARMWKRASRSIAALKAGDTRGAYRAAADSGVDRARTTPRPSSTPAGSR